VIATALSHETGCEAPGHPRASPSVGRSDIVSQTDHPEVPVDRHTPLQCYAADSGAGSPALAIKPHHADDGVARVENSVSRYDGETRLQVFRFLEDDDAGEGICEEEADYDDDVGAAASAVDGGGRSLVDSARGATAASTPSLLNRQGPSAPVSHPGEGGAVEAKGITHGTGQPVHFRHQPQHRSLQVAELEEAYVASVQVMMMHRILRKNCAET
jgi:hypothetical protein